MVQLLHPYKTTGKIVTLTIWTFVAKAMSLLFNMLSKLVIVFLSISWLLSPAAVILEPCKWGLQRKYDLSLFQFFAHLFPWSDGTRCYDLRFWMLSFKPAFSFSSFTFSKWLFSTCSISTIWVLSSAFLRLLIFLPEILISTCVSSSLDFTWCTLLLLLSHFSCVRLCATPQTAAHQAPLSLGFSRQER